MKILEALQLAYTLWTLINSARNTHPGDTLPLPAIRTRIGRQYWEIPATTARRIL